MDFAEIRRLTITALFADDKLVDELVLKGGNALNIVYELTTRTSLDLDFSIEKDFEDLKDVETRISRALSDRFDSAGYVVFDLTIQPKPQTDGSDERPWWGGYELNFKFIEKEKHLTFRDDLEKLRRNATVLAPRQRRTFRVDVSKHEFIQGKVSKELDHYTIYVYSPAMLAIEKLRAICQQMPEYGMRGHGTARARDFYDIHQILTKTGIDLTTADNFKMIRNVFAAKKVPLRLIGLIGQEREFHRPDWPAVQNSVAGNIEEFDYYFDFVVQEADRLESLWVEDS
jgi:predicted nucleotidyltransferase component of viral defense system